MAKGEIVIKEEFCLGCGYRAKFCARGCIVMSEDKVTPEGYFLPTFTDPERCTACGICSWMCPNFVIDVYKYVQEASYG